MRSAPELMSLAGEIRDVALRQWPAARPVTDEEWMKIARRHGVSDKRALDPEWDWIELSSGEGWILLLRRNSPFQEHTLFQFEWHGGQQVAGSAEVVRSAALALARCAEEIARWGEISGLRVDTRSDSRSNVWLRCYILVESRLLDAYLEHHGGVAWIRQRNVKVVEVARDWIARKGPAEEVRVETLYASGRGHPSLPEVYAALVYFQAHRSDMESEMRERDRQTEQLRGQSWTLAPSRADLESRSRE